MKKFGLIVILGLTFIGCGGGSSGGASSSYNLVDYLTTTDNSLKTWDLYKVSTDGAIIDNYSGTIKTTEIHMGDVREIPTIGTFYILDDGIHLGNVNSQAYKKEIKINDNGFRGCKWEKFHSSVTLKNGEGFDNVLELSCNRFKFYYAKNKGNIAMIDKDESKETIHMMINTITLKSLTIGEITTNNNKEFRLQ